MYSFYISKHRLKTGAAYLAALLLLVSGAGVFLNSADSGQPASAQPIPAQAYRSGDADSNKISLSINVDWGEEYLPQMLDTLAEKQVKATFFLTGRWCDNNPALAADIAAAGHELGNHGYSHSSPNASSKEEITEEIECTEQSIYQATQLTPRLYAPPSGEDDAHVLEAAAEAGYYTVLWSADTIDWQQPDAATVIERVKKKISGGGIILAHPTACTTEALPQLIDDMQEEGYQFVTVSENIGV